MKNVTLIIISLSLIFSGSLFAKRKAIIGIAKFRVVGVSKDFAELINENLTTYVVKTGKFNVVERSLLEKVLKEAKLSSSDLVSKRNAIKIGRILSARALIIGSIIKLGNMITLSARFVEVNSGTILRGEKVEFSNVSKISLACKIVIHKLLKLPVPESAEKELKKSGTAAYNNKGRKDNDSENETDERINRRSHNNDGKIKSSIVRVYARLYGVWVIDNSFRRFVVVFKPKNDFVVRILFKRRRFRRHRTAFGSFFVRGRNIIFRGPRGLLPGIRIVTLERNSMTIINQHGIRATMHRVRR